MYFDPRLSLDHFDDEPQSFTANKARKVIVTQLNQIYQSVKDIIDLCKKSFKSFNPIEINISKYSTKYSTNTPNCAFVSQGIKTKSSGSIALSTLRVFVDECKQEGDGKFSTLFDQWVYIF